MAPETPISRFCVTTRGKISVKLFHAATPEDLKSMILTMCQPRYKEKVLAAIDQIIQENDEENALLRQWKSEIQAIE